MLVLTKRNNARPPAARPAVFPGLYFHPGNFWADDLAALLKVLQDGLATPEHAAFTATLSGAR